MANVDDAVLHNILAQLPGKPLLQFRCVSKHWNGLISDPYFMKSRSRRMILLPFTRPLVVIDDTEAVKLPHSPLEHEEEVFFGILALNVKDMVFSNIKQPDELPFMQATLLGSIGGCLCVTNKVDYNRFNVWLMKEEWSWMKAHSFALIPFPLETSYLFPICILGNGQILFKSCSHQFVIYDTSNDSHKTLNGLPTVKEIKTSSDFNITYMFYHFHDLCCIECVESLVSPSDLCSN
ncbi:putative F-box domain-containing protein [Helianthus debilis subsp. tardiflorus]